MAAVPIRRIRARAWNMKHDLRLWQLTGCILCIRVCFAAALPPAVVHALAARPVHAPAIIFCTLQL